MFTSTRHWIRFYCMMRMKDHPLVPKFNSAVMGKVYAQYLKENKFEDKHNLLK